MKEWIKDNTRNPVLWLNGKPGAGMLDGPIPSADIDFSDREKCYVLLHSTILETDARDCYLLLLL